MPMHEGSAEAPRRGGDEPSEGFARAMEHAARNGGTDPAALRQVVAGFVAHARERQLAPQEVLIALKRELERVAAPHMERHAYEVLVGRLVQIAVDEYYRDR
jgi:hypothetical protein